MLGEKSRNDIKFNCIFMMLFGIWPIDKNASVVLKILMNLLLCVSIFLIFCQLIPCFICCFYEEKDMMAKLKLVGPMIFCVESIFKMLSFRKNIDKIHACLKHIEDDWKMYTSCDTIVRES
jgi:hypothetical protein